MNEILQANIANYDKIAKQKGQSNDCPLLFMFRLINRNMLTILGRDQG